MSLVDVERLREIAQMEFVDIVVEAIIPDINELRIILADGSFVDVWFSLKLQGRYSFHWERRAGTTPLRQCGAVGCSLDHMSSGSGGSMSVGY